MEEVYFMRMFVDFFCDPQISVKDRLVILKGFSESEHGTNVDPVSLRNITNYLRILLEDENDDIAEGKRKKMRISCFCYSTKIFYLVSICAELGNGYEILLSFLARIPIVHFAIYMSTLTGIDGIEEFSPLMNMGLNIGKLDTKSVQEEDLYKLQRIEALRIEPLFTNPAIVDKNELFWTMFCGMRKISCSSTMTAKCISYMEIKIGHYTLSDRLNGTYKKHQTGIHYTNPGFVSLAIK